MGERIYGDEKEQCLKGGVFWPKGEMNEVSEGVCVKYQQ